MKLSYWLAIVFAFVGGIIAGSLVVRHVKSSRSQAYAQAEQLGAITLEAVRALVQAQAREGRFTELGRNFADLVKQADVATIVVRDRKGKRILGRSDDPTLLSRQPKSNIPISKVVDGIYDVEAPVDLGSKGKGSVSVGFRTVRLEERLHRVAAEGFGSAVAAFLALALSAWFIGMFAGERIERVVTRIEKLAASTDNFKALRVGGIGGIELTRLVMAFNKMGLSLKSETIRRQQLENEKKELSAMLVHDLKTPLTVIRSGIALLAETAPKVDGVRQHARTFELLELSTLRLQRMVEDVLQLAKLEESAHLEKTELVDMSKIARDCSNDFEFIVSDRKQHLELLLSDGVSTVIGDATLLRRVLDNLVHNAVEHTPKDGTIIIEVSGDEHQVKVSVSDSGPGVPENARADIFKKFFQQDLKRHVGNVGLGLALCEKVVLRHGGSIGITDAKTKGACFYFKLPSQLLTKVA